MTWLILTVLLGLAGLSFTAYALMAPPRVDPGWSPRATGAVGAAVVGGIWLILTIFLSLHTVGQREVGLVQSFSGTIGANYKSPGVVFAAPWNHIKTENVGLQKEVFVFDSSNSAVSKDQQPITAVLAVNYQVEPAQVVRLWKTVGPQWKTVLLDGRIPQAFKETTAQFTSPEITLKRPLLRKITLRRLRQELTPYDIRVVDVFVSNVGYSKEYTAAIEAKQVQVQSALRAQAKVAQSRAEAEQKVAAARGEAEAIALEGKALHANPEVLRLRAINSINKKATVIFCSSGDCPSFLGGSFTTVGK